ARGGATGARWKRRRDLRATLAGDGARRWLAGFWSLQRQLHFRREPHDREAAEGRSDTFANPAVVPAAAVFVKVRVRQRATFRPATVQYHLHARQTREDSLELPVEGDVLASHDDELLRVGKRSRWQGFEELDLVGGADSMRRPRVV